MISARWAPLFAFLVFPCAPLPAANIAVTTDFACATSYVFRGRRLARHSVQPAVTIEGGGFSGGIWANVPADRAESHEIDPFFFYSFAATGLSWETGLQLYTYPEARGASTGYSCEVSLGATAPLGLITGLPLNAGATIYYDLRHATLSLEARLEHSTELHLARMPAEFAAGVFGGCVDRRALTPAAPGPKSRDAYGYYGVKLDLSVKLTARAALKLTGQWDDARNAAPGHGPTGNLSGVCTLSWVW